MAANKFPFKRVLIINIFGIGDVLFTTPLVRTLKAQVPGCFLGFICNRRTTEVVSSNPYIDKVFIYEKDEYADIYKKSKVDFLKKIIFEFKEIKNQNFDLVIDLSLNSYSNFFMWVAGIKRRIGFNYKNRSFLLTDKIPLKGYEDKHVIDYYADLLETLGIMMTDRHIELYTSETEDRLAYGFLKDYDVAHNDRIIAIFPGGGASWGKDAFCKRWPAEKYAQLSDKLIEKFSAKIILFGDAKEKKLCGRIADLMKHAPIDACGKTSIGRCCAILKHCNMAIVNDGGPLHVAVASGTKTVSVFGPVDENIYGPYPLDHHIVVTKKIACRPCYKRFRRAACEHQNCLKTLEVNDVLKGVGQAYERTIH